MQSTDVNGIHTCFGYDDLAREVSQSARCGSSDPLLTTTGYILIPIVNFAPPPNTPPNSVTVNVIRPPSGATTWTYLDNEGKTTGTVKRAFGGGFVGTLTSYNGLRKITALSKPFALASMTNQASPLFIKTFYDSFNRVEHVSDDLGVIDSSLKSKVEVVTTSYNGMTTKTDRTVNGQTQTRLESRSATGKVVSVVDDGDASVSYTFDAEGYITGTLATGGTTAVTLYDTRGRKTKTTDPDMGTWQYTFDGYGDLVSQTDAKEQR